MRNLFGESTTSCRVCQCLFLGVEIFAEHTLSGDTHVTILGSHSAFKQPSSELGSKLNNKLVTNEEDLQRFTYPGLLVE